ncbi:hypothetical protein HCB27_08490 [Listeria booriae]|uniref:Response regulatory domain-containing protein n=1 Tax=Listeria booriae TaxID=1552123 RepID=A0A7X1D8H7_9LIST|nr:hypothetical protein [Listeria booriae]MBC2176650.1 hypothetical protein [Listeria booriae]
MYRVGFIDDQDKHVGNYKKRLANHDIDLIYLKDSLKYSEILDWVLEEKLECLLIDYKLAPKYDFVGSKLANYINKQIFDLPCLLLTSYATDALRESLVSKSNIINKMDMREGIGQVSEIITQNIDVFRNRMELAEEEYRSNIPRYKRGEMSPNEVASLKEQYRILSGYHVIEEFDWENINQEIDLELTKIIDKLDKIIEKFEGFEDEKNI